MNSTPVPVGSTWSGMSDKVNINLDLGNRNANKVVKPSMQQLAAQKQQVTTATNNSAMNFGKREV